MTEAELYKELDETLEGCAKYLDDLLEKASDYSGKTEREIIEDEVRYIGMWQMMSEGYRKGVRIRIPRHPSPRYIKLERE